MLDKIKIAIDLETLNLLKKDCGNFNFYKPSGDINLNLFINSLIVNYYEEFNAAEDEFENELIEIIEKRTNTRNATLVDDIQNLFSKKATKHQALYTESLHLKPTKLSMDAIEDIINNLLNNCSISSYLRNLFNSYKHHPSYERELIMCKDIYLKLKKCIKNKRQAIITLKNGNLIKNASIYTIGASTEELWNYVLCVSNNVPQTIKLSKIQSIITLNETADIKENHILLFKEQIKYGIQYPIYEIKKDPVMIKLTEQGKKLYKKLYLYRPIYSSVKGDIYTFNCSYYQIIHYFKRFGSDAIVISPQKIAYRLKKYYSTANKTYDELNDNFEIFIEKQLIL